MLKQLLFGIMGNRAFVLGNENINIQDVHHSTINIGNITDEQIQQALAKFWERTKKKLYFVVYADFLNQNPHEWQPFEEKTIFTIINDCVKDLPQTGSVVWFIDSSAVLNRKIIAELKGIAPQTILLFCVKTLNDNKFYQCFDTQQIGGCIAIPSCDVEQYEDALGTVSLYRSDEQYKNNYKRTFKFALKNVCSDDDIAENINNILTAYMGHDADTTATITPQQQTHPTEKHSLTIDSIKFG